MPSVSVAALLLVPILASFHYIGSRTIFNLFAGDSMYYMGIANNFLKFGFPTFDGETVINGFHPLWEWTLIGMFKVFAIPHHEQIYAVFALAALLVFAAYAATSFTLAKILGAWPGLAATLMLFPGAYSIFFEPRRHLFNTPGMLGGLSPYSAINGMETSLSLLLWAIFSLTLISRFRLLSRDSGSSHEIQSYFPYSARICLAMLVLCRLDDCFLAAAISIVVLSQGGISFSKKISALSHILWPAVVASGAYIAFNQLTVGVPLPVSGMSKLSIAVTGNFQILFAALAGRATEKWWYEAICFYPVIFALLVGTVCAFFGRRYKNINSGTGENTFMMPLLNIFGLFLVIKALFLFLFVPVFQQGYWYFFSMVTVCNVIIAIAAGWHIRKNNKNTFAVLFVCLAVVLFRMPNDIYFIGSSNNQDSGFGANFDFPVAYPYTQNYSTISYALWNNSSEIRKFLVEQAPNAKLIDNLDGMYVYLLDMPGESVTGLASSPEELARRKEIGYLQRMVSREFSILPGYGYVNPERHPEIRVVDVLHPPSLPISFYRVELATGIP